MRADSTSSEAADKIAGRGARRKNSTKRQLNFANWIPVAVLVILCLGIGIVEPVFLSTGNFFRILETAKVPLVLSLGATFVILMGSIDLSVEGVVTLCGVVFCFLVLNGSNGNDFGLFGVAIVLALGGVLGLVNGLVHVKLRLPSFMVTLGMWFIAAGSANMLLGGMEVRITDPTIRALALHRFLGLSIGVWIALAALGAAWFIQQYTRLGRHIYALGGGEELAALSGISTARVRILTFMLAGVFSAVGSVLAVAQLGFSYARIGDGWLFNTITAVVVGGTLLTGGKGGVLQSFVGVLIIAVLANGMVLMGIPSSIQLAVQGLMIIAGVSLASSRKQSRIVK